MPDLRLSKLPDRTPVKIVISVTPELGRDLSEYAALYRETYGETEPVQALIPAMLQAFLDGDRAFVQHRRGSRR